jgi:heme/copper-type cytochrome/quinol oxidase subunit 1
MPQDGPVIRHLVWALGAVLVAVGLVVALVSEPAGDFGWFAYAPLGNDPGVGEPFGDIVLMSTRQVWGWVVVGVGAVVAAAGLGFVVGRRRRSTV